MCGTLGAVCDPKGAQALSTMEYFVMKESGQMKDTLAYGQFGDS